jgi:Tfp pilus assembly protein PilN
MQDINLLQNKLKDRTNQWEKNNRTIMVVLTIGLLAVLVATGMIYFLVKNAEESKAALDQENFNLQKKLTQMEAGMGLAKGFQAQSKNIARLLQSHVIWSAFMTELAGKTFKISQLNSMTTDTSGRAHMEGLAPTYTDLGKMLLALETSDKFESVTLSSTAQSTDAQAGIMFSLDLVAKQEVLIQND